MSLILCPASFTLGILYLKKWCHNWYICCKLIKPDLALSDFKTSLRTLNSKFMCWTFRQASKINAGFWGHNQNKKPCFFSPGLVILNLQCLIGQASQIYCSSLDLSYHAVDAVCHHFYKNVYFRLYQKGSCRRSDWIIDYGVMKWQLQGNLLPECVDLLPVWHPAIKVYKSQSLMAEFLDRLSENAATEAAPVRPPTGYHGGKQIWLYQLWSSFKLTKNVFFLRTRLDTLFWVHKFLWAILFPFSDR